MCAGTGHGQSCSQVSVVGRLLQPEPFYKTGGELSVFSVSASENSHIYTCLSVLKSIAQIFNMMWVRWGEEGKLKLCQESFLMGMKWSISPVPSSSLLEIPIQFNIKHSQSSVVKTSD